MESRVLQLNVNHAREAQALFLHSLAERECDLGIVAEPYTVPDSPNWVKSTDGSAALVRRHAPNSPPLSLITAGRGFVMAS